MITLTTSEPVREDMLDFPTAWRIQKETTLEHLPNCSSVPGWHPMAGPAFLCDCGSVQLAWEVLCRQQQNA